MSRVRGGGGVKHPGPARINLRPDGGGLLRAPLRFFPDCQKTAARSAAVFDTPYHTFFSQRLWKFKTQVTQGPVTRSRQMTSHHKKFEWSSNYTDWTIALQLSVIDTSNSFHKMMSQNFDIDGLRSGQFCDLSIKYMSMGENWKRLFWTKPILNTLKHRITGRFPTLNRKISPSTPPHAPRSCFRS